MNGERTRVAKISSDQLPAVFDTLLTKLVPEAHEISEDEARRLAARHGLPPSDGDLK